MKDAKTFANQLNLVLECDCRAKTTTITSSSGTTQVSKCQPRHIKPILKKEIEKKFEEEVKQQPWVGQYLVSQWKETDLEKESYNISKIWKGIPDVVYSVYTSILQQLVTTKVYFRKKLKDGEEDLSCRLCHRSEETVPHLFCNCSAIAQSLYKARHDRMLRPVYHEILSTFGFTADDNPTPWHKQPLPKSCMENDEAKILWDIPIHQDIAPRNGANRPDIMAMDKKNKTWLIIEGTVCNIGHITERNRKKTEKYTDLRASLKRLYPNYTIVQVNIVLDFLAGYQNQLVADLSGIGLRNGKDLLRKCQKWVISQNCEIVKALYM